MSVDYKITLCGNYAVGKSSLVARILHDEFDTVSSTIGAAFSAWNTTVDNNKLRVGLWDTAGQERFSTLLPIYLRYSNAILYCIAYDQIFDPVKVNEAFFEARHYAPNGTFYIVLTKIDKLPHIKRHLEIEQWALVKGVQCFYTSSLEGTGVKELFYDILKNLQSKKSYFRETITLDTPVKTRHCCST